MDAASYQWFGDIVTYLHLAVDKGTKKVLYGYLICRKHYMHIT